MRQIKFRGKSVKFGMWVEGYLASFGDRYADIYDGKSTHYLVFKDSVGQYVGFKDSKGKEIYEGDLIEIDWMDTRYPIHKMSHPVEWDEDNASWAFEGGAPKNDAKYYFRVIGNIYDNQTL